MVLDLDCHRLARELDRQAGLSFAYIRRGVAWEDVERLRALNLPGVNFIKEYRRFYPAGETAAHVVGITNIDDVGIDTFVARADELAAQAGPMKALYLPTEKLREMAASGGAFFGQAAAGAKK